MQIYAVFCVTLFVTSESLFRLYFLKLSKNQQNNHSPLILNMQIASYAEQFIMYFNRFSSSAMKA